MLSHLTKGWLHLSALNTCTRFCFFFLFSHFTPRLKSVRDYIFFHRYIYMHILYALEMYIKKQKIYEEQMNELNCPTFYLFFQVETR